MKRILVALLILLPLPVLAQGSGPSFDCTRARAWDERQICAQADLAELDRRLAAAWRAVTERATPEQRAQLQAQQRAWLAERRACEGPQAREAQSCVRRVMRARARDLEAAAAGGGAGNSSSAAAADPAKPPPATVPAVTALAAVSCPATNGWAAPRICATPGMRDLDAAVVRDAAAARIRFASQPTALTEIEALLARYVADREACAQAAGRVPLDCLQETMEEMRATLRQRAARG
ncbi:lysozyme inhibitor LprI family protein [Roseomonas fluvialis]|uniref:Lysozyme inhibitor LprI-like N-terminal domain-containing protein n=1 Tax=Roseomonas fluvialis TaxID=1750527 RepID=A0ABM7YAM5_9PROT|nr:lysozyme inhibitor LprI family protein [Roseomonas fluvialis]BDG75082.1 hypothetical protein Rmf_50110 [Roseomonas fluvialis]